MVLTRTEEPPSKQIDETVKKKRSKENHEECGECGSKDTDSCCTKKVGRQAMITKRKNGRKENGAKTFESTFSHSLCCHSFTTKQGLISLSHDILIGRCKKKEREAFVGAQNGVNSNQKKPPPEQIDETVEGKKKSQEKHEECGECGSRDTDSCCTKKVGRRQ
ncbi:hypothetical protein CDAR_503131 [Caerostris darwini]|uniref:Uncharacterized protein n=1 Tax=Caerostris darwini TaxID=1538125 RepID=A0AAV4VMU4_9ARAC|nr:hypothetical protein CDAR_503131 [Caerostris darwini]